jgi:hypothetical protein
MNETPVPFNANHRCPQVERAISQKSFQEMQKNAGAPQLAQNPSKVGAWNLPLSPVGSLSRF